MDVSVWGLFFYVLTLFDAFWNSEVLDSIRKVVCLTTVPWSLPKPVRHTVLSSASPFSFHYLIVFLRSSSNCLLLLRRLPVTSILPSIFLSVMCFRGQFLRQVWFIKLSFPFLLVVGYSLRPWLCVIFPDFHTTDPADFLSPSPVPHFKTFQVFLIHLLNFPSFSTIQSFVPNVAL